MKTFFLFIATVIINVAFIHAQQNASVVTSPQVESMKQYVNGNIYQKDFLLCMDMLKTTHPLFASDAVQKSWIDSLTNIGYGQLSACRTALEFEKYLQCILVRLHDGHTTVIPAVNQDLIYPLNCFIDGEDWYVRGVDKSFRECLGKKLKKVNGKSLAEVLKSFKEIVSADNNSYFLNKLAGYLSLYSMWERTSCVAPDSLLHLTLEDDVEITLKPMTRANLNIEWIKLPIGKNWIRGGRNVPFIYRILADKGICFLQFNSCTDRSSLYSQYLQTHKSVSDEIRQRLAQVPRFDEFLNKMFREVDSLHVRSLVVDVRSNAGGNSMLCDVLLSWLKPSSSLKQGSTFVRYSPLFSKQNPMLSQEYEKSFAERGRLLRNDTLYDAKTIGLAVNQDSVSFSASQNQLFKFNTDADRVFKGKVVFIQDAGTYSSAGMLVTAVRDNQIGVVIGDSSAYSPCSYGDILSWVLPHTGLRGSVSSKKFTRPDLKACGEASLAPDVLIPATWYDLLNGTDSCWVWALQNYSLVSN